MSESFMPDSSVTVAAALRFHPDHEPCRSEVERRLNRGDDMVLAAHSLAEVYSTLTRMPPPNRISPLNAIDLMRTNFLSRGRVVALQADDYVALLADLALFGVSGGRTYDAVLARTADQHRVDVFLTRNVRDFEGLLVHARLESPSPAHS